MNSMRSDECFFFFKKKHDIGLQIPHTESCFYDEEDYQINDEDDIRNGIKFMIVDTSRVVQTSKTVIYQVIRFFVVNGVEYPRLKLSQR